MALQCLVKFPMHTFFRRSDYGTNLLQFRKHGLHLPVAAEVSTALFDFPMLNKRVLLEHKPELSLILACIVDGGCSTLNLKERFLGSK